MKFLILKLIIFYQKTISPDHGILKHSHGQVCRFYPSCSEYVYQAIEKYGILKGGLKGIKRIFCCHPLNKGGYDPVD